MSPEPSVATDRNEERVGEVQGRPGQVGPRPTNTGGPPGAWPDAPSPVRFKTWLLCSGRNALTMGC